MNKIEKIKLGRELRKELPTKKEPLIFLPHTVGELEDYLEIIKNIPLPQEEGLKGVTYVMRGLPGSGKSLVSEYLITRQSSLKLSTDDLFIVGGEYKFDPRLLEYNHTRNFLRFLDVVDVTHPLVIDNTNLLEDWVSHYLEVSKFKGRVNVVINFLPSSIETHLSRNIHKVPREVLEDLGKKFFQEDPWTWKNVKIVINVPNDLDLTKLGR